MFEGAEGAMALHLRIPVREDHLLHQEIVRKLAFWPLRTLWRLLKRHVDSVVRPHGAILCGERMSLLHVILGSRALVQSFPLVLNVTLLSVVD